MADTVVADATDPSFESSAAPQVDETPAPSSTNADKPERAYSSGTVASTIYATDEDTEEDETKLAHEESKEFNDGETTSTS